MKYYEVLGVAPGASEREIKAAYRRLAREFHPDSGHPGDVTRFRDVQEAYETLSDAERRHVYDRAWNPEVPVSWTGGFEEPLAPFREIFPQVRREAPAQLDIVLNGREAVWGGEVILEIANDVDCPECSGTGFGFYGWCPTCRGEGFVRIREQVRFRIPKGADNGDVVLARAADGRSIRARIQVVGS
ncbi:MAG TPA: DnaJ domain-containing protein [Vicinamibacteria bacterium]